MKYGENNDVLAGVPFLSPSRAPRALARPDSPYSRILRILENVISSGKKNKQTNKQTKKATRACLKVYRKTHQNT